MRAILSLLTFVCLLPVAFGQLGTTITNVPADHPDMPYYFSGTNCRASGSVVQYGSWTTEVFNHYKLTVSGSGPTIVVEKFCGAPPLEPLGINKSIIIMFDSTRYANGSQITVKFEAWDVNSVHYEDEGSAVVNNHGVLYGRYDMEVDPLGYDIETGYFTGNSDWKGLDMFQNLLNEAHYSVDVTKSLGWTASQCVSDIEDATFFYVNTHGADSIGGRAFYSDTDDLHLYYPGEPGDDFEYITGTATALGLTPVLPHRVVANGNDLPPYNSGHTPPITLAFLDGCKCGVDNSFAEGFLYPYGNYYTGVGPYPENQALCGYQIDFQINRTSPCDYIFCDSLAAEETVDEAREVAYISYSYGLNDPGNAHDWMAVYGDFYTRICGVYTGSYWLPSPSTHWELVS